MINHKRKYIFIHIPKTAGVSVYEFLGNIKEQNHKTLFDYHDYKDIYFSFAVVRNPWDRLISAYYYMKLGGRGYKGDLFAKNIMEKYKDFKHFSMNLGEAQESLLKFNNPDNGKKIVGFPHLYPQSIWTHDKKIQIVDYIIHLENLEDDFNKIKKLIGKFSVKIPHKNFTDKKSVNTHYDYENIQTVLEYFKEDFDNFGYSKTPKY
jgi:hypothetical protein